MPEFVLIHKSGRGYYRDKAQGYAYLDGAGLFTRERAQVEARIEDAIRVVEPRDVLEQARRECEELLRRVQTLERIIVLGEQPY